MAAYAQGSEEALHLLYSRHSGKILGYLKSKLKSEQLALDVFQETFLKIHRSRYLYKQNLPALPWIFTIAHSVMLDGLRKAARKKEIFNLNLDSFPDPKGSLGSLAGSQSPNLALLPESQRTALELRYSGEKSFQEIALALETTPSNARQIVSRALNRLRKMTKGSSNG